MNKKLLLSIIFIHISSCSFQSNQYDFIRSLVTPKSSEKKPQKNWSLYWINKRIDLYAINFEDKVIFADENINIFFKNNQVYMITGLFPDEKTIEVDSENDLLKYTSNDNVISIDSCEEGKIININRLSREYIRSCSSANSQDIYTNYVTYNSEGMIIGMRFRIHPDYPAIQLSMK